MPRRKLAWLAPLVVLSLSSPSAWAQDSATAQVLFDQGRALMAEEKYAEACEKFAESQRLGPSSGTMLNLGECYAKQGKTASAWAAFKEAIPLAHSANQADREKYAREHVAQLESGLLRLAIKVPDAVAGPGFVVRRDGAPLGKAAWGVAAPVDPGPHVIEASAPKKVTWKVTVDMSAADPAREVFVPALADDAPPPVQPRQTPFTQRNIGLGVGALGLIGVAIGATFGLGAISTNDDAKEHCRTEDRCDAEGLSLKDSARSKATVSTVFFLLGAAAIGGGAILFLTAPDDAEKSKAVTRVRLSPVVGTSAGGLRVTGAW